MAVSKIRSLGTTENGVPIYEVVNFQDECILTFVRINETPEGKREDLMNFMAHQTRPLVEGLEPQDAIYPWDYANFLRPARDRFWD